MADGRAGRSDFASANWLVFCLDSLVDSMMVVRKAA